MAASKGYDNFATPEDTAITNNIMVFLNTFTNDANYRAVDVDLSAQKESMDKLEKSYQKLLEEQKDTEKKKSDAEVKLVQLQNDIEAKKIEIEKLKTEIDDLKTKRVNITQ
jgi:septal ring factor EnvC (AmiA/AmiB activator)